MMTSRQDCPLGCPSQSELDAFRGAGVDAMALVKPIAMRVALGLQAHDGRLDPDPDGERWFAFEEAAADDVVFWRRPTRQLATWSGRAFALGQEIIDQPATYSFDCALNIFDDPLDWLLARRDGIVILPDRWPLVFDRLRDAPRIAVAESQLPMYRRHMRPARLPEVFVIPDRRRAA